MPTNIDIWTKWFAWYPVDVDVYKPSEIKDGQMRYKVWGRLVEYRIRTINYSDDGNENGLCEVTDYRLPQ